MWAALGRGRPDREACDYLLGCVVVPRRWVGNEDVRMREWRRRISSLRRAEAGWVRWGSSLYLLLPNLWIRIWVGVFSHL